MADVFVHGNDSVMVWWSPEEERKVVALVEAAIRDAGGRWAASVTHSATLARCWIVEVRPEGGASPRRFLLDDTHPEPTAELRRALDEGMDVTRGVE